MLALANRNEQLAWPRPIVNFSGVYTTAYGDLTLEQVGNHIHGTYAGSNLNTMDGYVSNGVMVVDWSEPSGTGRAQFWIGADGKIEGTWGRGTSVTDGGEWDLVRKTR